MTSNHLTRVFQQTRRPVKSEYVEFKMKRCLIVFTVTTFLCGCPSYQGQVFQRGGNGGDGKETPSLIEQYNDLGFSFDKYNLLEKIYVNRDAPTEQFFGSVLARQPDDIDRDYKFNTQWHAPGNTNSTNWYLIELTFATHYLIRENIRTNERQCLHLISEYPCVLPTLLDYLIHFHDQLSSGAKQAIRGLDYRNEDVYFQGFLAYLHMKLFHAETMKNSQILRRAFEAPEEESKDRSYWETNYEMLLPRITELVKETKNQFLLATLVEMVDEVDAHWAEALSYSLADIALADLEFLLENTQRDERFLDLVGFGLYDGGMLVRFRQRYSDEIENPEYRFHSEIEILLRGGRPE
jgi:hypothetical protein